jgi:endoglucanase
MKFTGTIATLAGLVLPAALAQDKPNVPLSSSGRWIVDNGGSRVKLRCVNWPGHMEPNIPEGLNKQGLDYIADWIGDAGFNCVRLTFSIDMALNQNVGIEESFEKAVEDSGVDEEALMEQYEMAVEKNPFLVNATRIEVFEAVHDALWDRGILTVLDNHVSKAHWCCNLDDGNGWWSDAPGYIGANSEFFDTDEWLDGLKTIAEWSVGKEGIVGVSLRNELRAHVTQIPWGGAQWFEKMPRAARIVHEANPDVLVSIGGLDGGNNLGALRNGVMPTEDWKNKNVWDAHAYDFTVNTPDLGNCDILKAQWGFLFGFVLADDTDQQGPLWLSEFGVGMQDGPNDGLSDDHRDFLNCFVEYMENNDADWALWSLAGSYYVREGNVDHEDTYGALSKDWSDWRNDKFKGMLGKMWESTQGP